MKKSDAPTAGVNAFNNVESKVAKNVYATDSVEDWQKWQIKSREKTRPDQEFGGMAGIRAHKPLDRATPAFPLLGQWKGGESGQEKSKSKGEDLWGAEATHDTSVRGAMGVSESHHYDHFEGKRGGKRGPEDKEKELIDKAEAKRRKGLNKRKVQDGDDEEIPGVNSVPVVFDPRTGTCAPSVVCEMDAACDSTRNQSAAQAMDQVEKALNRAGTTPMIGLAQSKLGPVGSADTWVPVEDQNSGKIYYWHKETGETKWVLPSDWAKPKVAQEMQNNSGLGQYNAPSHLPRHSLTPGGRGNPIPAWKTAQDRAAGLGSGGMEGGPVRPSPPMEKPSLPVGWEEVPNPASTHDRDRVYYLNRGMGQTSWQRPSVVAEPTATTSGAEFIPSATFGGKLLGYMFSSGRLGVGYYKDVQQPQLRAEQPAPAAPAAPTAPTAPVAPVAALKMGAKPPPGPPPLPAGWERVSAGACSL